MKKLVCVLAVMLCLVASQAGASDRIRIGVLKFQNSSGVEPYYAGTIGDTFAQMLGVSEKLSVMGPDQLSLIAAQNNVALSGYVSRETAQEIGKIANCRYVVVGTVTSFKRKATSGGVWIAGSHKEEASAEADIRVYDTETGDTVLSDSASGKASQSGSYVVIYGISSGQSDLSGMDAGAISEVTSKLSLSVRDKIAGDSPKVTAKGAKEVTLDLGTLGGANKGSLYRIYAGSSSRPSNFAVVKITDAKSDYSKAVLADAKTAGSLSIVQKGDKIYPINAEEFKALQKKKGAFTKSRPRSSETENVDDLLNSSSETSLTPSEPAPAVSTSGKSYENESTDPAKVIPTYGLPSGEANTRRIAHTNAAKLGDKSKKAYDKYVELAGSYENDYLAAYRAGVIAKNLKKKKDAAKWLDKALEINPDYAPAQEAREGL